MTKERREEMHRLLDGVLDFETEKFNGLDASFQIMTSNKEFMLTISQNPFSKYYTQIKIGFGGNVGIQTTWVGDEAVGGPVEYTVDDLLQILGKGINNELAV